MSNHIVSVRIPRSLTTKLKEYAIEKHYMDVSEVVRTLLRKKSMERPSIKIPQKTSDKNYKSILSELDKIRNEIIKKMGETK